MRYVLFLLVLFFTNCKVSPDNKKISIKTIISDSVTPIITPESHQDLVSPLGLLYHKDQLLVYDSSLATMFVFDKDGTQKFKFGRRGEGPGEFQFIPEFWAFDNIYLLFNPSSAELLQYDTNGNYITQYPINAGTLSHYMDAKTTHQFYIPTAGRQGALFEFVDLDNDSSGFKVGNPIAPPTEGFDMKQLQHEVLSGKIPSMMRNQIILSSNESGVYSFQQSNLILQKFDHSGKLEWELNLDVASTEGVYEHYLETNKSMANRGQEMVTMLQYAADIEATDNGVALLLNTVDPNPVTVLWVPNMGTEIQELQFMGMESTDARPRSFTISGEESIVFFGGTSERIIYKSNWPGNF